MKYWAAFSVANLSLITSLHWIQNKKLNLKCKKTYIVSFVSFLLLVLNFEFSSPSYKVILNIFIYIFAAKFMFNETIKNSVLLGIIIVILNIIAEFLCILTSSTIIHYELFILQDCLTVFIQNIIIGLILILLSYYFGRKNSYFKMTKALNKIKTNKILVLSMLFIVLFNFFIWITCFISIDILENSLLVLIGSTISIFSVIFFYVYLKTNNSYKDVSEKYDLSLKSIEEYEKMIDISKMNNHETRNQFMTIRNMSKNKKITNYIDSLLDNKLNDSEQLLTEVSRLPRGGIRGLIYSKLLVMKEKNINYNLLIDRKISINKFNKLDDKVIVDVCKILGVFLDNAIEAVEKLKDKDIVIEIYADKKDIVFAITNNFIGKLEIEELSTAKYSTKGNGRGYGLSLVKDIINKSNILENSTEIYEDNFTQNLKIKM